MEGHQDRMVSGRRPRSHVDGDDDEEDVQSFDGEEVTTILLEEIGESHTEEQSCQRAFAKFYKCPGRP